MRLTDGGSYYGRVEVYDAATGIWGSVCGLSFDISDAQVIGRQLSLDSNSSSMSPLIVHGRQKSLSGPR